MNSLKIINFVILAKPSLNDPVFSLQNVTKYHLYNIAKLKKNLPEETLDIQELRYYIPDYLTF